MTPGGIVQTLGAAELITSVSGKFAVAAGG
jgi:hypothetical protein